MSNTNILRRMLEYISGEAFDLEQEHESWPQSPSEEQKNLEHRIKSVDLTVPKHGSKLTLARYPRYPHICAEMLLCDNHAVMTVLFSDIEAFLGVFVSKLSIRQYAETMLLRPSPFLERCSRQVPPGHRPTECSDGSLVTSQLFPSKQTTCRGNSVPLPSLSYNRCGHLTDL